MSFHLRSLIILAIFASSVVIAQERSSSSPASPFTWGFQLRMRIETHDNALTLSREAGGGASYMRNRSSLFAKYRPWPTLSVDARITNEMRSNLVPEARGFDGDEIFIDQLYVTWDSVAGIPLTLVLGRQNIMLGEGFVVMDGGPLDGSRSAYFNAARAEWAFSPTGRLMLAYIYQPERDRLLPVIDDKKKKLVEQPEEGFIVYCSEEVLEGNLQAYFIRKNMYAIDGFPTTAHINCPGARYDYPFTPDLHLVGEGAYQVGSWNDHGMEAFGGYLYCRYETGWTGFLPSALTAGGMHLSGDASGTWKYEGWDPLFSRWPKWSESYIYTLAPERLPAYWSNLGSLFAKLAFSFSQDMTLAFDYHHMTAPASTKGDPRRAFPGGIGTIRGDLFIAKLSFQIKKSLTGHVLYEGFKPGDYYFNGASAYSWVRMETTISL